MIVHGDPLGSVNNVDWKATRVIVRLKFALDRRPIAHEKDSMAILSGCVYGALDFRRRGFVAPHRVYCNGDHGFRLNRLRTACALGEFITRLWFR